jgi:hypothetical protein
VDPDPKLFAGLGSVFEVIFEDPDPKQDAPYQKSSKNNQKISYLIIMT